ncbi:MAG: glycosyltransferase family 61 protein, partial [Alphaproteobacteria bacterium]|nr:glycosyltransferase family 61 protein [Alphaproteobacteria bacterium]
MNRSYQLLPARRWFPPVADFEALRSGGEGMMTVRPAFVETVDPPDFFADAADIAGIGDGRGLGYQMDQARLSIDEAFLAVKEDARVEKLTEFPYPLNTYHLFLTPSLALAETQHTLFSHAHMMDHLGEPLTALVDGRPVSVPLRRDHEPGQHVEGEALLLASRFTHFNYFHWIVDLLPRLSFLAPFPEPEAVTLLMPDRRLTAFQREILQALGIANPMRALSSHIARVDRLYVPSFFAPGGYSRAQFGWLAGRLRAAFGVAGGGGGRRLWLSRADA